MALDVAALIAGVTAPAISCGDATGLDQGELERLAERLESLSESEIIGILNVVPSVWPVTDEQLGTLGWFLYERAAGVANRVRSLST